MKLPTKQLAKTTPIVLAESGIMNLGSIPNALKGHTEKGHNKLKHYNQSTLKPLVGSNIIKKFFILKQFQFIVSASDKTFYHQTKIPISFLYKRELNFKSLIQSSKTLLVKLTGIYIYINLVAINHQNNPKKSMVSLLGMPMLRVSHNSLYMAIPFLLYINDNMSHLQS